MLLEIQPIKASVLLKSFAIHCTMGSLHSVCRTSLPCRGYQLNSIGKSSAYRCCSTYLCTDLCFCQVLPLWIQFFHTWKREREKKHVIGAQRSHLKHHNERGCTHNWAGINQGRKLWPSISHLGNLFSPVPDNSRRCFPM